MLLKWFSLGHCQRHWLHSGQDNYSVKIQVKKLYNSDIHIALVEF